MQLRDSGKTGILSVRVSPAERDALAAAAAAAGLDLPTWLRRELFRAAGIPSAARAAVKVRTGRPPSRPVDRDGSADVPR
jgi:hypothetical protein